MRPSPRLIEIDSLLQAGRTGEASARADAALRAGERHPLLFNLVADALEQAGRFEEAAACLARGLDFAPTDPGLSTALGMCLVKLRRPGEARRAFERALALQRDNVGALYGLADLLLADAAPARALEHLRRAAALAPGWPEPAAAAAEANLQLDDLVQARIWARRAVALAPDHAAAALVLARVEAREGRRDAAEPSLRALAARPGADPETRIGAWSALADLLDADSRPAEAFDAWRARNALIRQQWAPAFAGPAQDMIERIGRLTHRFAQTPTPVWAPPDSAPEPDGASGHAFLVGFPRSGTTLLEQVLAGHPAVVALEEGPTLLDAERTFLIDPDGLEKLATLDAATAASFRAAYWRRVREAGVEPCGKLFLDKMPINTVNLPLVAALFPKAKVLFALRDPRDVVLSCLRQRFRANAATYQLLDLTDAARLYADVMALAELYRAALRLELREVRYESLVADLEGEARGLLAFLDLDWDPAVLAFAQTAQRRVIRTPSAAQVRGALVSGEGRWRGYGSQMEAVAPVLAPWVARFGYAAT